MTARAPVRWRRGYVAAYALGFLLAEGLMLSQRPALALAVHAVLLLGLLLGSHLSEGRESDLHIALIVPVTVRLFVLGFPLGLLPQEAHLALAGSVVLVGTVMAARLTGYSLRHELRLNMHHAALVPLVVLSGVPLGFIAYGLTRPEALVATLTPAAIAWPAVSLLLFTGLSEELLYRGLLLTASTRWLGIGPGIALSSVFYAGSHLSSGSWPLAGLALATGLAWGWLALRLGSVTGLAVAHGGANILLLMILPQVA